MLTCRRIATGVVALGTALLIHGTAFAAERGSAEDQLACTPDVYRLCSSLVPDEDAIVACLNRNVRALSPACRSVMTRPASHANGAGDEDSD